MAIIDSPGRAQPPTSDPESPSSCVHRGAASGRTCASAVELRSSYTGLAVDERGDHPGLADRTRPTIEQVAIEHDEVGRLADLDRSDLAVEVVGPGRAAGEAGQRVVEVDPLVGQEGRPPAAVLVARRARPPPPSGAAGPPSRRSSPSPSRSSRPLAAATRTDTSGRPVRDPRTGSSAPPSGPRARPSRPGRRPRRRAPGTARCRRGGRAGGARSAAGCRSDRWPAARPRRHRARRARRDRRWHGRGPGTRAHRAARRPPRRRRARSGCRRGSRWAAHRGRGTARARRP